MKTVALISGGKDSCYNMMQCVAEGHHVVALANLRPKDRDELDSYMYQTVGHQAIDLYAEAMQLPLYRRTIEGSSLSQDKDYSVNSGDEVEDLFQLLKSIKEEIPIEAVSVGAILSDYQRVRVEHVCQRLDLTVLAYLWRRDQTVLLQEMIQCGVKAIIIKVAALGLEPDIHLGMTLEQIYPHMIKMKDRFGLNVCGEGGEYETFTLDCPLFKKRIVVDEMIKVLHSDDAFAPVAFLNFNKMHLESKNILPGVSQRDMIKDLPMMNSNQLISEMVLKREESLHQQPKQTCSLRTKHISKAWPVQSYISNKYLSIAGIVGLKLSKESITDTTQAAMKKMKDVLSENNLSPSDVLAVYLCVQDMNDFIHINKMYKKYFHSNPPIRVCIEACLPQNIMLQLDCLCKLSGSLANCDAYTMHVQSLSHWAPANIGPYSQATKIGSEVFLAGQIGLNPANLNIIEGGVVPESRLSLRHIDRILAAMTTGGGLSDVVAAICYVTNQDNISTIEEHLNIVQKSQVVDDKKGPFSVLYVVVPSLPKSAQVEWQMYAVTGSDRDWEDWAASDRCDMYTCNVILHQSHSDTDTYLSFIISVAKTTDPSCNGEEQAAMHMAVEGLNKLFKHVPGSARHLRVLRVFYRADVFSADQINQAYAAKVEEESFQWTGDNKPIATFIPVLGFHNDRTLLSMYH